MGMQLKSKEIVFILVLGLLISTLGMCNYLRDRQQADTEEEGQTQEHIYIYVHVAGQVRSPGVYSLSAESRVLDAIEAAGGALQEADVHRLNLADYLVDGQKITVPAKIDAGTESDQQQEGLSDQQQEGLININTADQSTLELLPNIGPSRAASIIQYRENHGLFNSIEEITNVNMIGEKIYESIKDLITT